VRWHGAYPYRQRLTTAWVAGTSPAKANVLLVAGISRRLCSLSQP